ncbi:HD domain-containing protein [Candidatus Poribacteria bacterium]|nr:HD domain-containing protein [Candidatus Poribacteria bacterium]MYG07825.1 HD domain-containing protein [Candidatus Poribacteria bacterium]MYK20896.1 HD domain-containing protein [Candidatus Poribacteria bacterium]
METILKELRTHPKSIEIQQYLSDKLSAKRFQHVLAVQEMAIDLACLHKADVWHANLAALLHDSAKWMNPQALYSAIRSYEIRLDPIEEITPSLLHPLIGVKLAVEKFAVTDLEVLEAIRNHTTGNPSMGVISQILYVADFAEPTRTHNAVQVVREFAYIDLGRAVHHVARAKIEHLLDKGVTIHPNTLHTYNSTLESVNT